MGTTDERVIAGAEPDTRMKARMLEEDELDRMIAERDGVEPEEDPDGDA